MAPAAVHREGVAIRALAHSDRRGLGFVFGHLGADSRDQRFLTPMRELSERELKRLIDVGHWHHEALIAWSTSPRAPIGVARYVRADEFDLAELAVVVADEWQRAGVGAELMRVLAEHACRAGVRRFTATALAGNRGAIAVARRLDGSLAVARHGSVVELSGSLALTPAAHGRSENARAAPSPRRPAGVIV